MWTPQLNKKIIHKRHSNKSCIMLGFSFVCILWQNNNNNASRNKTMTWDEVWILNGELGFEIEKKRENITQYQK